MNINPRFKYPPPIATLGFDLVDCSERSATIEILTDVAKHANPMGTVHCGVLCDVADAAIETAHAMSLGEGDVKRRESIRKIGGTIWVSSKERLR